MALPFGQPNLNRIRAFIGFIGINLNLHRLPCSPCVEIGWRIAPKYCRKSYASEGAITSLEFAFNKAKLDKIIPITPLLNKPSEGVMIKIGMKNT